MELCEMLWYLESRKECAQRLLITTQPGRVNLDALESLLNATLSSWDRIGREKCFNIVKIFLGGKSLRNVLVLNIGKQLKFKYHSWDKQIKFFDTLHKLLIKEPEENLE